MGHPPANCPTAAILLDCINCARESRKAAWVFCNSAYSLALDDGVAQLVAEHRQNVRIRE